MDTVYQQQASKQIQPLLFFLAFQVVLATCMPSWIMQCGEKEEKVPHGDGNTGKESIFLHCSAYSI